MRDSVIRETLYAVYELSDGFPLLTFHLPLHLWRFKLLDELTML